jgi:hypothetical protein
MSPAGVRARFARPDKALRLGLLHVFAAIGVQLAEGAPTRQVLRTLEDEMAALQPAVEAARRAEAEAWLEQIARAPKPRKPRRTQGWIRRNGRALVEAAEAGQ